MTAFLAPIEKPRGLTMKMVYFFVRRQFGTVITPVKVHSAGIGSDGLCERSGVNAAAKPG
jgi:hypothetical protein